MLLSEPDARSTTCPPRGCRRPRTWQDFGAVAPIERRNSRLHETSQALAASDRSDGFERESVFKHDSLESLRVQLPQRANT